MSAAPRLPNATPPHVTTTRQGWLLLVVMLRGMWLWKTQTEATPPPVAYSQFYGLVAQDKVQSRGAQRRDAGRQPEGA